MPLPASCMQHKARHACVCAQSCPTLCNPMDCSSPGSSVHRIFPARIQSWLPFPPLGDLPNPGIKPESPVSAALARGFFFFFFFLPQSPWEALSNLLGLLYVFWQIPLCYLDCIMKSEILLTTTMWPWWDFRQILPHFQSFSFVYCLYGLPLENYRESIS